MHYHEPDVWYLIQRGPYLRLAKASSGLALLRRMCRTTELYAHVLAAYPAVRCEPLDLHYVCLESLGALDLPLFQDLVLECNWRGIVWGAWLAALAPRAEFLPGLIGAKSRAPMNDWIVGLAIDTIEGRSRAANVEATACTTVVREALAALAKPPAPLRRAPDARERARLEEERSCARDRYRAGGARAVADYLPGTLLERFVLTYPEWRRRNAASGEAPDRDAS